MALRFFGLPTAHTSWSIDEDAVSKDRANAPSGLPQAQISGLGNGHVLGLKEAPVIADSAEYGRTKLAVNSVTQGATAWSVTADTALTGLDKKCKITPLYNVSLADGFNHFVAAAGASIKLQVDASISSRKTSVPAGYDNVWTLLRRWLSANSLDMCYVYDTAVLYPMGAHTINVQDVSTDWTISISDGEKVGTVNCYVYHRTPFTNGLVYPPFATMYPNSAKHFVDTDSATTVISVNSGETTSVEVSLGAEVSSLGNPTCVASIPMKNGAVSLDTTTYPNGIYAVVGQDNKAITPAQWKAEGGDLTVELGDDGKTATITVTGATNSELGPYRIAESAGGTDYAALYLVAPSGQYVDIETVEFDTGVVGDEDTTEIDNPAIDSLDKAYAAAAYTANVNSGFTVALSWSGPDPMRSPFKDFAMDWAVKTATLKDVQNLTGVPLPEKAEDQWPSGTTMSKINSDIREHMRDGAASSLRRQSFGRLGGSRFYLQGFWWRVTSATYSDSGVSITAQADTILADLQRRYATIGDWDQPSNATLLNLSTKGFL